jgi:hypothetical protein
MAVTVTGHGKSRIHLGKPATERIWVSPVS